MKKHLLAPFCVLAILCFISNPLFSQFRVNQAAHPALKTYHSGTISSPLPDSDPDKSGIVFRLRLAAGPVFSRDHDYMAGMDFSLEKPVSKAVSATLSAGFNYFKMDPSREENELFFAPFKLGAKIWLGKGYFIHPEAGFTVGVSDDNNPLNYGASIGKVFKNGFSLGVGFESQKTTRFQEDFDYKDPIFAVLKADFQLYRGPVNLNPTVIASPPEDNGRKRSYALMEFAGAGLGISLQFDQRFNRDRNDGLGFRAGLGTISSVTSLPLGLNYIYGKGRSGLEIGLGVTPFYDSNPEESGIYSDQNSFEVSPIFTVGYRLQSYNGFMLRLNNSIIYEDREVFSLLPGLSVGLRIR